jgi:hypothetical protein
MSFFSNWGGGAAISTARRLVKWRSSGLSNVRCWLTADEQLIYSVMIRSKWVKRQLAWRNGSLASTPADQPARNTQARYNICRDGAPVRIAGLWDQWRDRTNGERIQSATMIITEPNAFVRKSMTGCRSYWRRRILNRGSPRRPALSS